MIFTRDTEQKIRRSQSVRDLLLHRSGRARRGVEAIQTKDQGRREELGYHEIAEKQPKTAMRLHSSKFRKQMEAIRELGIRVITLDEFTAWKKGEGKLPEQSILITFDDGWKSVYTNACPILKELGIPVTIFLYKNYADGSGKALTTPMIEEMKRYRAKIGRHSVSHPYPLTVKSSRKKGPDAYDAYRHKEMGESKRFLESKFRTKVTTYAYPGGHLTKEVTLLGEEFGYDFMFTVLPGKIKRSLPNEKIPAMSSSGTTTRFGKTPPPSAKDPVAPVLAPVARNSDSSRRPHTRYPRRPEPSSTHISRKFQRIYQKLRTSIPRHSP